MGMIPGMPSWISQGQGADGTDRIKGSGHFKCNNGPSIHVHHG